MRQWHELFAKNELGVEYLVDEGMLYYQKRIAVPNNQNLRNQIFNLFHVVLMVGHGGMKPI